MNRTRYGSVTMVPSVPPLWAYMDMLPNPEAYQITLSPVLIELHQQYHLPTNPQHSLPSGVVGRADKSQPSDLVILVTGPILRLSRGPTSTTSLT